MYSQNSFATLKKTGKKALCRYLLLYIETESLLEKPMSFSYKKSNGFLKAVHKAICTNMDFASISF